MGKASAKGRRPGQKGHGKKTAKKAKTAGVPQRAKRYTDEQRKRILATAKDKGVTYAANKHNATPQIIHKWRRNSNGKRAKLGRPVGKKPTKKSGGKSKKLDGAKILNFAKRHGKQAAADKFGVSLSRVSQLRKAA